MIDILAWEEARMARAKNQIVVSGDVSIDWMGVRTPGCTEGPASHNWRRHDGVPMFARLGGAYLLTDFVREFCGDGFDIKGPTVPGKAIENVPPAECIHSMVVIREYPSSKERPGKLVYRVEQCNGFAGPRHGNSPYPKDSEGNRADARFVVLDDAGNGFREWPDKWPLAIGADGNDPFIILKMGEPLATGNLWHRVVGNYAENTLLFISADDLRGLGAQVSRRLSWERTAEEVVWQLAYNPRLKPLTSCRHLVIRFGIDAAIHCEKRDDGFHHRFYFDPACAEGEFAAQFEGTMIGYSGAFVAGLLAAISSETDTQRAHAKVGEGVRAGILAARRVLQRGIPTPFLVEDEEESDEGGRRTEQAELLIKDSLIQDVEVASPESADERFHHARAWTILDAWNVERVPDLPAYIVTEGLEKAVGAPRGVFGDFVTIDRHEIESFRAIRNLIGEYLERPDVKRPLCIAVFGKPGSGKSFGVENVAKSVSRDVKVVTFNVAQFQSPRDLAQALNSVRDVSIGKEFPLVFFDEFDASVDGKSFYWLKHFLQPMQDGVFTDEGRIHPIGRAIFVFAGGTSETYEHFCNLPKPDNVKDEDFISRLRGFVDIAGPDPQHSGDSAYRLRRAVILRGLLKKLRLIEPDGRARIDPGIVRAMIEVQEFKHGVRSMESILEMSLLSEARAFDPSALPSEKQLELHVDAKKFYELMLRPGHVGTHRERLAQAIHRQFQKDHEKDKPADAPEMLDWDELPDKFKESNRQQADSIPHKLESLGLKVFDTEAPDPVLSFSRETIDTLAREEHERWMAERRLAGWVLGETDKDNNVHADLVDWSELTPEIKQYDVKGVEAIPSLLSDAGLWIHPVVDEDDFIQQLIDSERDLIVAHVPSALPSPPTSGSGLAIAVSHSSPPKGPGATKPDAKPELPWDRVDLLHYSVSGPSSVPPGGSFLLEVWAHLRDQFDEVRELARQTTDEDVLRIRSKGPVEVPHGTKLTVDISVNGLDVDDPWDAIEWRGEVGNAVFAIRVPEDTALGKYRAKATIHAAGVRKTRLYFDIAVGKHEGAPGVVPIRVDRHRRAFVSYSRKDQKDVSSRLHGMSKIDPELKLEVDKLTLRSGEYWEKKLLGIIPICDVFYLFWSANAQKSEWVEREWRCALDWRGLDFIDPVPLVSPEEVPPPPELAAKHFDDWLLAFERSS